MNREQLDQRHTAIYRRYYRTIIDNGGQLPQQMLDQLFAVTVQYADDRDAEHANPAIAAGLVLPPSEMIPVKTERASAPARTAPRQTTARRTTK
ncbi:MAG: hypothetical protein ACRDPY_15265 [Streptosporangiaceae bacterium]